MTKPERQPNAAGYRSGFLFSLIATDSFVTFVSLWWFPSSKIIATLLFRDKNGANVVHSMREGGTL